MARTGIRSTFQDPVTTIYATAADALAAGLYPGLVRFEDDGTTNGTKKYQFFATNGAFTQYQCAALYLTDTSLKTVIASSAAKQFVVGAAQVAITTGYYAWIQTGGLMTAKTHAGTAIVAGDPLTGSTTAGALVQATETGSLTYKHVNAIAVDANASGDANSLVYMKM